MIRGNSVGLEASVELQRKSEQLLNQNSTEISHLFSRIGTAEIATDPMGPNVCGYLRLLPSAPETWRLVEGRRATRPTSSN